MRDCPHRTIDGRSLVCGLVPFVRIAGPQSPNCPCRTCEWQDKPPTQPTPTLLRIVGNGIALNKATGKHPDSCEHMDHAIRRAGGCKSKLWLCEVRGEVTLATCATCNEFVKIG